MLTSNYVPHDSFSSVSYDYPGPVPYDYCKLGDNPSEVDKYLAEKSVPRVTVYKGDIERIKALPLENLGQPDKYEILLVPVGYTQVKEDQMKNIAGSLTKAYKDIGVQFLYLNISVPVGIERLEQVAFLSNEKEAEIILKKTGVDMTAYVINTDEYMGGGGRFPKFAGNHNATAYLSTHEIAHGLSLNDGYERFYGEKRLNGSELFLSIDGLRPSIKKAYEKIKPPVISTGNVCEKRPVFTFYSYGDVMDSFYWDSEFKKKMEDNWSPFNPLQIEIMNSYVNDSKK